ncbi:glycosyltransferase family 4 protein [Pedobacter sp. MC2016-24]|uniref:glycosyltransferase family 4 protein n=1 Tax=Pedobacter sp. MC2016-24 TaxID=2780090 RepID=UPI001D1656B2|nr:glycosyltransferase family 4 protein [Pedobacter sp. MC2016-24]
MINTLNGGGAERVISNLGNHFCQKNFEVTMVCLNEAKPAYFLDPKIKIHSLIDKDRKQFFGFRLYYALRTFFKLFLLLKREKPAAIVSFMTSANIWTGLSCLFIKIPYFVSERITPDYTVNRFSFMLNKLAAKLYGRSKAIVVPSTGMIAAFKKNSAFKELHNFKVINNPVNRFGSSEMSILYPNKFILAVGRLDPQKGFDLLIKAFKKMDIADLDLLICGEGAERCNLELQIARLHLKRKVKLIGFQADLSAYYRQAEIFVLSSRNEGYPNALVEAMSLGCACIAADCEFGPADIIDHGKNGLLVKPNEVNALYKAMNGLIYDAALKAKLSVNAIRINQTNSTENTAAKWEQLVLSHI